MSESPHSHSHAPYLAGPAAPPHDPFRLPLSARSGWRMMHSDGVEVEPATGALALIPAALSGPSLTEPHGSFGGLAPPRNVAVGADRSVWLLDAGSCMLKRFDPCECVFETVPCIGGIGSEPRQWGAKTVPDPASCEGTAIEYRAPGGIGICGGNLFVADTINARLQVFALHGMALRAIWTPPPGAGLAQEWAPADVTFDSRGQVLVSDPANGCVHVFNAGGCWLRCIDNVGAADAIVTDCEDRLYVRIPGQDTVDVYDLTTGALTERVDRTDAIAARFPLCFAALTADGDLDLGWICTPPAELRFGLDGSPRDDAGTTTGAIYPPGGRAWIGPLDSRLHECPWDRASLTVDAPDGTRIKIESYAAETELSSEHVLALGDDAWGTRLSTDPKSAAGGTWDALLRSATGRYLWLRLSFSGHGAATPRLKELILDYPRISLRRYLPAILGLEPSSAEFSDRFLAIMDRGHREVETTLDDQAVFYDPLSAPAQRPDRDFLGWLASWVGVTLDRSLPLARRRALLKAAGRLFEKRGTLPGLRAMLMLFLGLPAEADCEPLPECGPCTTKTPPEWQPPELLLEQYRLRRWLFLCHGRLGDQAKVWGARIVNRSQLSGNVAGGNAQLGVSQLITTQDPFRDPFHVYAHRYSVFVPTCIGRSEAMRRGLRRLLRAEAPAHTQVKIVYVEPRMRIGIQSMIGFDAVIGCYPAPNVRVGEIHLGRASVLGPSRKGGPTLRVGQNSRIGTTTRLH